MTTVISTWDSGLPGSVFDAGLDWDVNSGGIAQASIAAWLALITSEHAPQPNFMTTLGVLLQPLADDIALLNTFPASFDLDAAVGAQLDAAGQWLNTTRYIQTALTGVYFAFDMAGQGFDAGVWWNPYSPATTLTALPDDIYRNLLKFNVKINQWDGTIPSVLNAWNSVFASKGYVLLVQDYRHMHMGYAIHGTVADPTTQGLYLAGYFSPKPAGVQVDYLMTPSVAATPYFGFDVQNTHIAGFDTGAWGVLNPGF
jgi:hypothetical protein